MSIHFNSIIVMMFHLNSMFEQLMQPEVQQFIHEHEADDEKMLVLKHKAILGVPTALIAEQISGRRKAKTKLPTYYKTPNILYPPGLNLEQTSSEKTAIFKTEILAGLPKQNSIADVTGGLGVDSFFFSKLFKSVYHVEPNESLQKMAQHNHEQLKAGATHYHCCTAEPFIDLLENKIDCIYIDPSRRTAGQKVFRLTDCEPNVVELLPKFFKHTDYVLIKTSPLLDIQQGLQDLHHVEKVWVVAVDNECKELLFLCNKDFIGEPEICAINLLNESIENFSFMLSAEKNETVSFSEPMHYLYEPNAAILKAGAFKLIGQRFDLFKLHSSTHLYTSENFVEIFPGRIFKILRRVKPDAKLLLQIFTDGKANIITRNYPLSVDELKKKTKLKDGGEKYLIGFSGVKEKYLVAAERVK
jgi:16S rRNA G966 N2-methylase RsmD